MDKRDGFAVLEGGLASLAPGAVATSRPTISAKSVSDPNELARILTELRAEMDRFRRQSALPFTGGVLVRAISFGVGVNIIAHKLGRPPRDIFQTVCTVASVLTIATLPSGYDPAQFCAINATVATVGSLLVT